MNRIISDKLSIYSKIPANKVKIIEEAVSAGLVAVKQSLAIDKEVKIRFWVVVRQKNNVPSWGYTTKKFINISITKSYLNSRNIFDNLSGTVIHEYIHYLRLNSSKHNAKTVLQAVVEEGIAIYIQAILSVPPKYLDIKTLNEEMVRLCWDKLSNIINKPSKKYPQIEKNEIYRAIYYRLGFGIVRKFIELNPKITLANLVNIENKKLVKFAIGTYGK